jgi:outer membrane protein TolC
MRTLVFRTAAPVVSLVLGWFPGSAWAQRAPAPPPRPPAQPAPAPVAAPPPLDPIPEDPVGRWGGVAPSTTPLSLLEALQTTLRVHPSILSAQADVASKAAQVGIARGPFDPAFLAGFSHNHNVTPVLPSVRQDPNETAVITDTTSLNVGAAANTTIGTTIAPAVGLQRVYQRATNSVQLFGSPYQQQATIGLAVTQKLLRGAGTVGAASAIEGARGNHAASVNTLAQTAEERAFDTAVAYFALVAATRNVTLLRAAENDARQTVEQTRILVESNQRPRADLHQLEGNLATRTNALVGAENDQLQALYALRNAMGLPADAFAYWAPTDALPAPRMPSEDRNALIEQARKNRSDVKAAHDLVAANAALFRGADWNTMPELDLNASIGYAGGLEKDGVNAFFAAAGNNVEGANAGIGLSLELPWNNTAQRSQRDFTRAQLDEARINAMDVERRLPFDVLGALDDLRLSAATLQASTDAVHGYEQAVADEKDKVKAGVGTVLDMLVTQEFLVTAELTQTANHLRYATALARLRFEMGLLPSVPEGAARAVPELLN